MLTELCAELNNYFLAHKEQDIHFGTYTIEDGSIDVDFLLDGQYFRIVGSVLNDGVYKYPVADLVDETFEGAIWAMAVPKAVIALASDIESWSEENASVLDSPYTSESFGGYSYSKESGAGGGLTWKDHFGSRLNKWRKESPL